MKPKRQKKSDRYALFIGLLKQLDHRWVAEYRFHATRMWRFDVARPDIKLAVEIDGGCWVKGRHSRGKGQIEDMAKSNAAVIDGWQVLHFPPEQIADGTAYRVIHFLHHRNTI